MQHTGGMDGGERPTHLDPYPCRLLHRQRTSTCDLLRQRLAAHVLRPDADAAIDAFGPVDGQHVGMADPREQSSFLDDR